MNGDVPAHKAELEGGEKGGEGSEKCRVSSDQRRKIARNSRAAVVVAGFATNTHTP